MTYRKFLEFLSRTRRIWILWGDLLQIRSFSRNDKKNSGASCCPVTSVATMITGKRYCITQFEKAARDIGLRRDTMTKIVKATDTRPGYNERVRADLIKALPPIPGSF